MININIESDDDETDDKNEINENLFKNTKNI